MKLVRYDNLIAIKTDSGKVVGYHAHNLQVAHLDELVWQALAKPAHTPVNTPVDPKSKEVPVPDEVRDEIVAWNE